MVGAQVTMMASALMERGIDHAHQVLWQMEQWFEEHDIKSVNHLRGRLSDEGFALSHPPYVLSS